MEFWIVIGVLISTVLLYPYLRIGVKRLILAWKIRKACRLEHMTLRTRPLWFFRSKNGKKYDFSVETRHRIFAVKLFAVKNRRTVLVFDSMGRWHLRKYLALAAHVGLVRMPLDAKPHPLPDYSFYPEQGNGFGKAVVPILLIHPVCMEFRYDGKVVGCGESVYGITLYNLPHFLGMLTNESQGM